MIEANMGPTTGPQVGSVALVRATPGNRDAVLVVLARMQEHVAGEEGALTWVAHEDRDDADLVVLYERYADQATLERHWGTQVHEEVIEALTPLLAEEPRIYVLTNFMVGVAEPHLS